MSVIQPIYAQHRTPWHTVLFKAKSDQTLVISIYNIAQERIFRRKLSPTDTGILDHRLMLIEESPASLVEKFIQNKILSKEELPSLNSQDVTIAECLQDIQQLISQVKPEIVLENSELQKFLCPIPTFALFSKSNPNIAQKNIEMASVYEEAEEYEEAIIAYSQAFKFTKDPQKYAPIPVLFRKMKQPHKALLASLYLALYQLEEKQIPEAIQVLKEALKDFPSPLIPQLLVKLYRTNGQKKEALQLALEQGEILVGEHHQEAISLLKQALILSPDPVSACLFLVSLLENPQEKAQLLLAGACHALHQEDFSLVQELCERAGALQPDSFIDQLLQINLLKQQKHDPQIKQKLLALAQYYEEKNLTSQVVKTSKMLTYIDYNPDYYQKIIEGLRLMNKPQQALKWTISSLPILIQKESWKAAEDLAEKVLDSVEYTNVPFYENLETIYINSIYDNTKFCVTFLKGSISFGYPDDKLANLWAMRGKAYSENKQFIQAEKIYQKAFDHFKDKRVFVRAWPFAIELAFTLYYQNNTSQSVNTLYKAFALALLENDLEQADIFVRNILILDPKMQHLDLAQRIQLLTHNQIFKLCEEVKFLKLEIESLKKPIDPLNMVNLEKTFTMPPFGQFDPSEKDASGRRLFHITQKKDGKRQN